MRHVIVLLASSLLFACGGEDPLDAGPGVDDAGPPGADAGPGDAGPGATDAGPGDVDAGCMAVPRCGWTGTAISCDGTMSPPPSTCTGDVCCSGVCDPGPRDPQICCDTTTGEITTLSYNGGGCDMETMTCPARCPDP